LRKTIKHSKTIDPLINPVRSDPLYGQIGKSVSSKNSVVVVNEEIDLMNLFRDVLEQ